MNKLIATIKQFFSTLSLLFIFTFSIFFVMISTMTFIGLAGYVLIKTGFVRDLFYLNPNSELIFLFVMSLIITGVTTSLISRLILKPFQQVQAAMEAFSNGDFNIRIKTNGFLYVKELVLFSERFNKLGEELGSIEILRTDFVNNFSHEFKTPIASMRGFAKLLKEDDLTREERNEFLDIIISESERLSGLSTNVLNLSKIENQAIVSENAMFNLSEQIRQIILMIDTKWHEKKLLIDIEMEEIEFQGNEEILSQLWFNLLDNAAKFSQQGGKLEIATLDFFDYVAVKIQDYGCGMEANTAEHIYDKFYQGDLSRSMKGNGLGMAIVKKIVVLYGGEISIESNLNQGTLVTIALPKQKLL